eukprot:4191606-Pleurochrysis_carterae.AAC.2
MPCIEHGAPSSSAVHSPSLTAGQASPSLAADSASVSRCSAGGCIEPELRGVRDSLPEASAAPRASAVHASATPVVQAPHGPE